jgi:hypothetical protein
MQLEGQACKERVAKLVIELLAKACEVKWWARPVEE